MKRPFIPIVSQPGAEGPGGFPGMPAAPSSSSSSSIFSGYVRPLEGWIITSHQPVKAARHIVWASRCTLSPPVNWVPSPSMPSIKEEEEEEGGPRNDLSSAPWHPCAPITFAAGDTVCVLNGTNRNTTTTTSTSSSLFEIRVIAYTPSSNQADFILQPLKSVLGGAGGSFSTANPHDVTQHWPGTECDPEEIAMRAVDEVNAKNNPAMGPSTTSPLPLSMPLPPLSAASTILSAPPSVGTPQAVKFTSGLPAIKPQALPPTSLPLASQQQSQQSQQSQQQQQQQQQQATAVTSPSLSTSPMVSSMGLPFKRPANFCNYFGFALPQKPYVCGGLPGIAPSGDMSGNGASNDDGDTLQISGGTSSLLSSSSSTSMLPSTVPPSSTSMLPSTVPSTATTSMLPSTVPPSSTSMLPSTVPSTSTSTAASIQQQQKQQQQLMQGGNKKDDPTARISGFRGSSLFSQKISMTVAQKKRDMAVGQSVQHGSTSPAPLPLSSSTSSSSSSSNNPQVLPSFPVIVSSSSPAVKDAPLVPSPKQSFFSLGPVTSLPLAVPPIVGSSANKVPPPPQQSPNDAPGSIPKVVSGSIPSVVSNGIPNKVTSSIPSIAPSVPSSAQEEPAGGEDNSPGDKEPCESCNPIANFNDVESVNARGAPDAPRLVELFSRYAESFARFKAEYAKKVEVVSGGGGGGGVGVGSEVSSCLKKEFNDLICAHRLEEQQAVISSEISLLCSQGKQ